MYCSEACKKKAYRRRGASPTASTAEITTEADTSAEDLSTDASVDDESRVKSGESVIANTKLYSVGPFTLEVVREKETLYYLAKPIRVLLGLKPDAVDDFVDKAYKKEIDDYLYLTKEGVYSLLLASPKAGKFRKMVMEKLGVRQGRTGVKLSDNDKKLAEEDYAVEVLLKIAAKSTQKST